MGKQLGNHTHPAGATRGENNETVKDKKRRAVDNHLPKVRAADILVMINAGEVRWTDVFFARVSGDTPATGCCRKTQCLQADSGVVSAEYLFADF